MIKVLKSDELDVRNSPLDRFASISASLDGGLSGPPKRHVSVGPYGPPETRILLCSKGVCEAAAPVGVVLVEWQVLMNLEKQKD